MQHLTEKENNSLPTIISIEEKKIKEQKPPNNKIVYFNRVEEDTESE